MEPLRITSESKLKASVPIDDLRTQMIRETETWLSWAMINSDRVPRIPRRRADEGGFTAMLARPGARAVVRHWWSRTLELVDHFS